MVRRRKRLLVIRSPGLKIGILCLLFCVRTNSQHGSIWPNRCCRLWTISRGVLGNRWLFHLQERFSRLLFSRIFDILLIERRLLRL